MVGRGILPNNMRFPSSECYTIFWRMTIYTDTLLWWDITPIFDPLLIWTLLPYLTLLPNCVRFTFATGAASQQKTLTPADTWSCSTLGLTCVLMSRAISPKLVLFPDFLVSNSNIPRYFCFAWKDVIFKNIKYLYTKRYDATKTYLRWVYSSMPCLFSLQSLSNCKGG